MTDTVNLYDLNRKERGAILANQADIEQVHDGWRVPSQTGTGTYIVTLTDDNETCTCPDYKSRDRRCKHIHAVEFTKEYFVSEKGTIVTETVKKTYSQDWAAYNEAQTNEYRLFMELLADLCELIPEPDQAGRGRPSKPLRDMVFACALKVYSGFSLRRFESMMEVALERGHISETCDYTTISRYMNKPALNAILHDLIAVSSAPLSILDTAFAVDSSGFSTSRFGRYYDYKHGEEQKYRKWVKAHICTGVKTNIIPAVSLTEGKAGDSPEFEPLVNRTAEVFDIAEVSGRCSIESDVRLT